MSGFKGFLFRIGDFNVTGQNIIKEESYKASLKIQDLDPLRDGNGSLHRNVLENVPIKVIISTRDNLTNEELQEFWQNIRSKMIIPKERKLNATFWVPELNDYVTQDIYVADPEFQIKCIKDNTIYYSSMQFSFTGY